jgi:CRP/FNR family transcriptional regulator, cyclic AMP receptor protein
MMTSRMRRRSTSRLTVLRQLKIFEDFSVAELARVDALTCETRIPAGRTVMAQGQVGREALIVLSGYADVRVDGAVVAHIGTGDIAGEMALLDGKPRSATVVAATEMRVLVLDRGQFSELLRNPRAALAVAGCVSRRLQDAEREIRRRGRVR